MLENEEFEQDEGFLAVVVDGCVKGIALALGITAQRVHQIIANDPFAAYMRIHRALLSKCPSRAQEMADRFNRTHEQLMGGCAHAHTATGEALGKVAAEGADVMQAQLLSRPIKERRREAHDQIRALYEYLDALDEEENSLEQVAASTPDAFRSEEGLSNSSRPRSAFNSRRRAR